MKLSDSKLWNDLKQEHHPQVRETVAFAEKWADTMEDAMKDGFSLAKVINPTLDECYTANVTAEIQDSAALLLRDCWSYGRKFFKIYAIGTGRRSWVKQLKREDDKAKQLKIIARKKMKKS